MRILSAALSELPYKLVAQLIAKINAQIAKQAGAKPEAKLDG